MLNFALILFQQNLFFTSSYFIIQHIYFGNMRSHSEMKTRRPWRPNVQTKHYKSDLLGQVMKVKVTTSAIRSIDKVCFGVFNFQSEC